MLTQAHTQLTFEQYLAYEDQVQSAIFPELNLTTQQILQGGK